MCPQAMFPHLPRPTETSCQPSDIERKLKPKPQQRRNTLNTTRVRERTERFRAQSNLFIDSNSLHFDVRNVD